MRAIALGLLVCAATAARADGLPVKNVSSIRVAVAGGAQKALALKPTPGGYWRLDLDGDGKSASVIDLTPGTPARTLTIDVVMSTLKFDNVRFAAGHVYRVALDGTRHASLVYLYPDATAKVAPKKSGTQRVRFDADDANVKDEGGIARVDKGSL